MTSISKIKKDKVEFLKVLRDIVQRQRAAEDTDRREARRLKIYCKEIDKWIEELKQQKELIESERKHHEEIRVQREQVLASRVDIHQ